MQNMIQLSASFWKPYRHVTRRWMTSSSKSEPATTTASASPVGNNNPPKVSSVAAKYKPSDLQKTFLVWTKNFKSKDAIPEFVPYEVIDRMQSQARIKIANILMILTVLASIGAILSGKAAAKRGESVQKINQEFHRKYEDQYNKKQSMEQSK